MAATLASVDPESSFIDAQLGAEWSVLESSFKWHASCRDTHPSVDALIALMEEEKIKFDDIESTTAYTYKAAIKVLSLSASAETVYQSKFSTEFVLAVAAKNGPAKIRNFTEDALSDSELRTMWKRVTMVLDPKTDAVFPAKWLGRVTVSTKEGRTVNKNVDVVKGDPGWTLTKSEIEGKAFSLVRYGHVQDLGLFEATIQIIWNLEADKETRGFVFS
ncbi:uncharacterized protein Z519_12229 [Cladophialophora bantiana CBS 173.52]|uniref:MmgE/PrpD C-terminal domain-containing protein n=1 Tax=Cladophialophora bantiana (strain ATCC 10958 / CBS 173.52 / CDC B-1940 / NIH 8579) TaxID=1442370 RepID=A0A0D2H1I9_CLAB1|nr:uncharacterized protein Z519_12229 [Cladophialophora bantiana CBS 173.52]KIW87118.1 hypothetical protein Z519_12229 [Cladophialophora bantiana CBS 173.52]